MIQFRVKSENTLHIKQLTALPLRRMEDGVENGKEEHYILYIVCIFFTCV